MATVTPITDALSAPPSSTLVLPALTAAPSAASSASAGATSNTLSTAAALIDTTNPLTVVFDALATAGLDSAIDQTVLSPPTDQTAGAFSSFMDQLFAALAAQTTARQAAAAEAKAAASPTVAAGNSALENDVQSLASQLQATSTAAAVTDGAATAAATLTPLQQSFDTLIATAGGTTDSNGLPTFLQALATNLHSAPSPLGNIVNSLV